jgi:hypothetical protein
MVDKRPFCATLSYRIDDWRCAVVGMTRTRGPTTPQAEAAREARMDGGCFPSPTRAFSAARQHLGWKTSSNEATLRSFPIPHTRLTTLLTIVGDGKDPSLSQFPFSSKPRGGQGSTPKKAGL